MYYPDSIPILCYHSIDGRDSSVFMDPRSFAAQMRYMKRKGFTTLSLEEIVNYTRDGTASDGKPIGIVFDDGYKNNYTEAFPVLQEVGFQATIFLAINYCGKVNDWRSQHKSIPLLPMMTWEEVKEMSRHGIELGSHTMSHPKLAEVPTEQALAELVGAKEEIENHVGREVAFASYPFGSFNDRVRGFAQSVF